MDNSAPFEAPSYETASLSRRFGALFMDLILVYGVVMSLLIFWILPSYFHDEWQDFLQLIRSSALITSLFPDKMIHMFWVSQKISFLLTWAYFGISEWLWSGRTLGKAILAMRSISGPESHFITTPRSWQHILRSWMKSIALSSPFLFFDLLPLCFPNAHRRCLHDLLSRTQVILDVDENIIRANPS
jgi:uncharacterized RDD family membrane protein YckC